MSGGSRVPIPKNVHKTIQNIKEIAGNHSDEVVYAMLKECSMNPNETAQKLLLQDTFHEVKMKRDMKKENVTNGEATGSRWRPRTQRRGGRGVRGSYIKEHKNAEKYRQQGCPLDNKLALVVGNSITMGTVSQTSVDMCNSVQHEEENSRLDMLEDVDLGRDTPSPFFTESESAPDQSQSGNPSISSRCRKRSKMSIDDSFIFLDTIMKEIVVVLHYVIKSYHDKTVGENWYEALTEIPDLSIEMKYRAPLLLDTPMKKEMFTKLPVEERLSLLSFFLVKCSQ